MIIKLWGCDVQRLEQLMELDDSDDLVLNRDCFAVITDGFFGLKRGRVTKVSVEVIPCLTAQFYG